nr:MAG TPA: hypothetical protein [Caudoviricetes sp.]
MLGSTRRSRGTLYGGGGRCAIFTAAGAKK